MNKNEVLSLIDKRSSELKEMALTIWNFAETAMNEKKSSQLQKDFLRSEGFNIKDVPNMDTAFIAEVGEGYPVIGLLGEYDALPQLSQKVQATKESREDVTDGHGCGHNLLGTGSLGAALVLKEALDSGTFKGTLRYYGCPAEETLSGKVLMAKEGVFQDLDAALTWHPAQMNVVWGCSFLAMNSLSFRFKGTPAHAAAAPEAGRSALDGVELMNVGSNYLREHVKSSARIHYTITDGGGAPNTVPAHAESWFYVRAPKRSEVKEITERLIKIAKGAAMMTETEVEVTLLAGCYDVQTNNILSNILHQNMKDIGGPQFTDDAYKFAKELKSVNDKKTIESVMQSYWAPKEVLEKDLVDTVYRIDDHDKVMAGSTDAGDVSYITPFAQLTAATWPIGVAAHTWMACSSSGSEIGLSAMLFAAKSLAATVYDLFDNPSIVEEANKEFKQIMGESNYISPYDE